jgi:squalene-hopene/tetraprenyl-beta-curcumene cyclase
MSFTVPGIFALGLMQARTQPRTRLRSLVDLAARRPALSYLEGLQRFEGYGGGFEESPMLAAVVLLGLARAGLGRDIARRCHDYLLATRRPDGSWAVNRDLEFTSSCAVLMGLQESGLAHEARLLPARHRVLSAQRTEYFPATGAPPGGWSWSLPSGWPDTDDTAGALTVLAGWGLTAAEPRVRAGARWLLRMQRGNGSWGCFVTRGIAGLDAPCPMLTAHALEGLRASTRISAGHPAARRAFGYLAATQRRDGSFPTLWYRNYTMGTAAVLTAYGVFGLADVIPARLARRWLLDHQRPDGSWNDGGSSEPSVEETSWALYALLATGLPARSGPAAGASRWLAGQQLPDGGWPPTTLGVYFPNLYFSSDHLATGYALRTLGNLRQRLRQDRPR